jgi:hypothetical protein
VAVEQIRLLLLIMGITLLSGIADGQGFIHAAKVWHDGKLVWAEVGRSALGFAVGSMMYWTSLKYMKQVGIVTPEIQTMVWFAVTIVGVALTSGKLLTWTRLDQGVAVGVLFGIGWLLYRTSG